MGWAGKILKAANPFKIVGNVWDDLTGVSSAKKANKAAIEQSQVARDWEERMSNTSYQRATADMLKAGLNPMLAYSQGGASTPATSAANVTQEQPGGLISGAGKLMSMRLSQQQLQQNAANIELTKATTAKATAEAESTALDARIRAWDEPYAAANSADKRDTIASNAKEAEARANRAAQEVKNLVLEYERGKQDLDQKRAIQKAVTDLAKAEAQLKQYQLPEAKGSAEFYDTTGQTNWWGRLGMNVFRSLKEIFK